MSEASTLGFAAPSFVVRRADLQSIDGCQAGAGVQGCPAGVYLAGGLEADRDPPGRHLLLLLRQLILAGRATAQLPIHCERPLHHKVTSFSLVALMIRTSKSILCGGWRLASTCGHMGGGSALYATMEQLNLIEPGAGCSVSSGLCLAAMK